MTEKEKKEINALANLFYRMHGYQESNDFDFSKSTHPQEKGMFELAKASKQFWKFRFNAKKKDKTT